MIKLVVPFLLRHIFEWSWIALFGAEMDQHNTVLNLSSSDLNLPFPQISDKRIYVIKLESINPYIETVCRLFFSRSEKLTDYM